MRLNSNKSRKNLIITLSVIVVLAISGGAYALMLQANNSSDTNTTKDNGDSTDNSSSSSDSSTDTDPSDTESTTADPDSKTQQTYEGENANTSTSLTGVISYKSVVDTNLVIRTTIDQMISSGTCSLTLSNGQKTVTRASDIMLNPSSSTCEGFDIPTSELGGGTWSIEIDISGGNKTGTLTGNVSL